ncbi:MAG: hypothetical protein LBP53_08395 [Candidatus Peribacteria bacterium]|jgi:hypothetical protein|nr:hypothetical protein [Candidatus Peribacteria bacterium]
MRKKLIVMFLSLVLVFQHSFSFAQSTSSSPENDVCGAPAPMMLLYQQFQSEMASALLGGGLGEKIFEATVSPWGLFTSKVLRLPTTDNSVADSLLTSLWNNVRRLGQASLTTVALLTLSALSVGSSNLEGLSILWQDRVIVREWKTLLQIETKLSQIAYHLGKQANIVAQLENTNNLKRILEKYQEAGLFTGVAGSSNASYFDILSQLAIMNSAMKIFISTTATAGLSAYHSEKLFNVQFASGAYTQLKNDYRSVRTPYSACSEVFDNLASNAKKAVGGVGTATKDS